MSRATEALQNSRNRIATKASNAKDWKKMKFAFPDAGPSQSHESMT